MTISKTAALLLTTALTAAPAFAQTLPLNPPAPAQATATEDQDAAPVAQTGDPVADARIAADLARRRAAAPDPRTDIVVTGTRIVRLNNRSAAPIVTTTAAEIQAQGAINIEEVLNRLPQVAPNAEQNLNDGDAGGRQRVKLRNLGFERTLPLVDGLRLGLSNGLDVGILPADLIERVDVLSGGASSVYGSDAVSGVINYVLKNSYEGVTVSGNYNFYNHVNRENAVTAAAQRAGLAFPLGLTNDGGRGNATVTVGKSFLDGRLNVSGFASYRFASLLQLGARSTSACEVVLPDRNNPNLACNTATFTQVGTIIPLAGANANRLLVNDPNGLGTFVPLGTPGTVATPFDTTASQREFNRVNAGGFINLRVSDAFEVRSSTLLYRARSQNESLNQNLSRLNFPGQAPFEVNCDNPFLSPSQAQILCGAAAGTAARVPLDVRFRFDSFRAPATQFEQQGLRQTLTVRGRVFEDAWTYDVSGMFSRNRNVQRFRDTPGRDQTVRSLLVVNRGGVPTCQSVIDGTDPACVPFNAFRPFNNSQALQGYLFTDQTAESGSESQLFQGLAVFAGDLGKYGITSPLAESGVAVAFGAEYRNERFAGTANSSFRAQAGGQDTRFTQNVWEGNVEVQVPLVENQSWTEFLQVNGGYRLSKYNRLQGRFDTWKVEAIWSPITDITLRGSINKAQRAPTVIEATQAADVVFSTGFYQDPCASTPDPTNANRRLPPTATIEACRATGLPDNLYGSATLFCENNCTVRNGGFGLTPETAFTKTFGVVLRPRFLPGLTVSIDRFLIDLDDSISFFQANDYLTGCLNVRTDFYCRGVIRNPGTFTLNSPTQGDPTTGFVLQGTTNTFKSKAHGWDIQGQYDLNLGPVGRLNFGFNGSLATLFGGRDAPDLPQRRCQGLLGPQCGEGFPKWTHGLRTTYTTPDSAANVSLNWRYIGPMDYTFQVTDTSAGLPVRPEAFRTVYQGIGAYNYIDLSAGFNIARRFSLNFAVNNLFDRDPPIVPGSRSLDFLVRSNTVFRYDLLGRQINIGASVRF